MEIINKSCLLIELLAFVSTVYFPGLVNCCSGNSNFDSEEYIFTAINTTTTVNFDETTKKDDSYHERLSTKNFEESTKSNATKERVHNSNSGKARKGYLQKVV